MFCEKRFTTSGNANAHQRTHTGEKPHGCQHCDKAFAQKNYLREHCTKHHPDKEQVPRGHTTGPFQNKA